MGIKVDESIARMAPGTTYRDPRDGWAMGTAAMARVAALDVPFALAMARCATKEDVGPELLETYVLGGMRHLDLVVDAYEKRLWAKGSHCANVVAGRLAAMSALGALASGLPNEKRVALMWKMLGVPQPRARQHVTAALDWMLELADKAARRYSRALGKMADEP